MRNYIATCFFLLINQTAFAYSIDYESRLHQETNFYDLNIDTYNIFKNAETMFIAIDKDEYIYLVGRNSNKISKLHILNDHVELLSEFTIEEIKKGSIQDIHVSLDGRFYISTSGLLPSRKGCYGVALYESNLKFDQFKKIFETSPCIDNSKVGTSALSGVIASNSESVFIAFSNIIDPDDLSLLMCQNYGYKKCLAYYDYMGSVFRIQKISHHAENIARGHRRPQGLVWDHTRGKLWSTDNGPRGGDELNLTKEGSNYGWPNVSLGRYYSPDEVRNFDLIHYNSHVGFQSPTFAWVPSVGISQLNYIKKDSLFADYWSDDLIVSTLKDLSIYRLRVNDGVVVYSERINIGERLRDVETSKKFIILATDSGKLVVIGKRKNIPYGIFPKINMPPKLGSHKAEAALFLNNFIQHLNDKFNYYCLHLNRLRSTFIKYCKSLIKRL